MQTFLPYPSFARSARVLDSRRLGKQRVEAMQILNVLLRPASPGWRNHPAVRMWRGHERCLFDYALAICAEWTRRGYRDTVASKIGQLAPLVGGDRSRPAWLGSRRFHASHRSNLLRKAPAHYGRFGWREGPELEYIWPVGSTAAGASAGSDNQQIQKKSRKILAKASQS